MQVNPDTAERIVLSEAAAKKLDEILERPSEPTPALVALMKGRRRPEAARDVDQDDGPSI